MKLVISIDIPEEVAGQVELEKLSSELRASVVHHLAYEKSEWTNAEWTEDEDENQEDLLWWTENILSKFDEMVKNIEVRIWGNKS